MNKFLSHNFLLFSFTFILSLSAVLGNASLEAGVKKDVVPGVSPEPVTSSAKPTDNTTTTTTPKITTPTTTSTTAAPHTSKPTTTTSTTTSTTPIPTTTPASNSTTSKPNPTPPTPAPPTPKTRSFDIASFIGGIVLTIGLTAIGIVSYKFYKAREENNYRTI